LRVYALLALFHAALGAAGMWSLTRARGRCREAAAVAALGFGASAFMVLQTRHAMFVATAAWLPWLLRAIERLTQNRRLEHVAAAGFFTAMAILAGGWSMLLFLAPFVGVYAIARLMATEGRLRSRGAVALASAALLGIALAGVQLL